MAMIVYYQGYTIQSAPQFRADWEKWQLHILIAVHDQRGPQTREFSADVLYATEQEADVHGIAFGQRVIDGNVEGQSVKDMKTADRRTTPRLRVQFRTTFVDPAKRKVTGTMLDLSADGGRIQSPVSVEPGIWSELRIHVPGLLWPLMVAAASIRWVREPMFGLAFFRVSASEQQRLEQVIEDLREN